MSAIPGHNKFVQQALKYGFSLWGTSPTEQTTSFRTGDDGYFKKGYPRNGARFTDNGDGTITDNATGLMWVKEPGAIGGNFGSAGSPAKMTWNNAIDECLALNYAGHNNWRLPNIKELLSIQQWQTGPPTINTAFFPNTVSANYWTSSTLTAYSLNAWVVPFGEWGISAVAKTGTQYVRPVRLGVPKD